MILTGSDVDDHKQIIRNSFPSKTDLWLQGWSKKGSWCSARKSRDGRNYSTHDWM